MHFQVNSLITRSEATETELGGLIDGVNALIVQLHRPPSLRGAGTLADVDTDDAVSPSGGDTSSSGNSAGFIDNGSDTGGSDDGGGTEME